MTYLSRIEWEGLQEGYKIGEFGPIRSKFLPQRIDEFEIFRDQDYKIKGKIKGEFDEFEELEIFKFEGPPGSFIEPLNFWINDSFEEDEEPIVKYEINNCVGGLFNSFHPDWKKFEFNFSASSIKRTFKGSSEPVWITEWFLNGPHDLIYTATTLHELTKNYERKRKPSTNLKGLELINLKVIDDELNENNKFRVRSSSTGDYIPVKFQYEEEEMKFLIHSVPDTLGPSWSKKVGIEYRCKWGIPKFEERKKIKEIVSFIFGKQLLNVGWTKFDKEGWIIEDEVFSPKIPSDTNIINICESADESPINIKIYQSTFNKNIETYFKQLIPNYLTLRDQLNLHEVLWRYWLAQYSPFYARLSSLAASFELLLNSWYESNKSKSHGNFLPHKEFMEIFKDELESINKKLKTIEFENEEFSGRLFNKIIGSNQMGYNASIHFFFKEIGLDVGEIEQKAIRSRNISAHGHIVEDEKVKELIKCEYAYKTLFNRVLLKILGFEGAYIDYYSLNYPERHIDEIIGDSTF